MPNFVACVSFDGPLGPLDFPPALISDLTDRDVWLQPGSSCDYEPAKLAYFLKQGHKRATFVHCGRSGGSSAGSGSVEIDCDIVPGAGLGATGWGFVIHRSFWGGLIIEDLGNRWIS